MIGDDQTPSWIPVGQMTSVSDSPDTDDIKAFIKKKGFDPAHYHIKLIPKGKKNIIQKIFEVAIMPKPGGVSDVVVQKGQSSSLNTQMDAPLSDFTPAIQRGAPLDYRLNAPLGDTPKKQKRSKRGGNGGSPLNTRMDAPLSDSFGAPPAGEMTMGRRLHSIHHEEDTNPDRWYNEEDVYGVGGGAGMFGTPASSLISGTDEEGVIRIQGFNEPTIRNEPFPYKTGMGDSIKERLFEKVKDQKEEELKKLKGWHSTTVIMGYTIDDSAANFNKMKDKLKAKFPTRDFKIQEGGASIPVGLIQKRTMGFIWATVKSIVPPDTARANQVIAQLKMTNPKAEFRMKIDNKKPFFLFQKVN